MKNLEGLKFGRLTVLRRSKGAWWVCECECGNCKEVAGFQLRNGNNKSCGCLHSPEQRARRAEKHGGANHRLYRIWQAMRTRCSNPNTVHYHRYGGRGISVCPEWQTMFTVFESWAKSNGYTDSLSIDRIDLDGNYTPSNCRWVTPRENANNTSRNVLVTVDGETLPFTYMAEKWGIKIQTVRSRIVDGGWDVPKAFKTRPRGKK